MTPKNNASEVAKSNTELTTHEDFLKSHAFEATLTMPSTEQLGQLQHATTGMSLSVKYRTQEDWIELKGQPVRCFYMGLKEIPNDKNEMVLCAGFMSVDGVFLAAQMVLIEAVRRIPKNTPIEIVFNGKKKNRTSDGSTNLFDVTLLKIAGNE